MEKKDDFRPQWIEQYHVNTVVLSSCVEQWEYLYQKERGTIYLCRPWQGIMVWANVVHMSSLPCETATTDYPFIKLNYCTQGRCEVLLENGKYVYLEPGMLSIDCNQPKESFRYPTKEYEGLEMVFNLEELEKHPVEILEELGIGRKRQEELRGRNQGSFIANVSNEWDVLAKALISRLREADGRIEDFRFLCIQILYLLECGHTALLKNVYVTKGQRRIAEEAKEKLCDSLKRNYTVEQLAKEVGISPSALKKYFVMVYGSPISEYVREKRVELACRLLRETDYSIGAVAEAAGYAHQGKFGSVFKKYTGQTPLEYRRRNRERREG